MPKVRLKVSRGLCQSLNIEPTAAERISISAPEGETIAGMLCRLTTETGEFWRSIFDEKTQEIGAQVLVVLNGRILNPYNRSEALLKEGDELMLLPPCDGG